MHEDVCSVIHMVFSYPSLQIRNNIKRVFSKFLHEGKATIKFKEPAHDLSISKVFGCVCVRVCEREGG